MSTAFSEHCPDEGVVHERTMNRPAYSAHMQIVLVGESNKPEFEVRVVCDGKRRSTARCRYTLHLEFAKLKTGSVKAIEGINEYEPRPDVTP